MYGTSKASLIFIPRLILSLGFTRDVEFSTPLRPLFDETMAISSFDSDMRRLVCLRNFPGLGGREVELAGFGWRWGFGVGRLGRRVGILRGFGGLLRRRYERARRWVLGGIVRG